MQKRSIQLKYWHIILCLQNGRWKYFINRCHHSTWRLNNNNNCRQPIDHAERWYVCSQRWHETVHELSAQEQIVILSGIKLLREEIPSLIAEKAAKKVTENDTSYAGITKPKSKKTEEKKKHVPNVAETKRKLTQEIPVKPANDAQEPRANNNKEKPNANIVWIGTSISNVLNQDKF